MVVVVVIVIVPNVVGKKIGGGYLSEPWLVANLIMKSNGVTSISSLDPSFAVVFMIVSVESAILYSSFSYPDKGLGSGTGRCCSCILPFHY